MDQGWNRQGWNQQAVVPTAATSRQSRACDRRAECPNANSALCFHPAAVPQECTASLQGASNGILEAKTKAPETLSPSKRKPYELNPKPCKPEKP